MILLLFCASVLKCLKEKNQESVIKLILPAGGTQLTKATREHIDRWLISLLDYLNFVTTYNQSGMFTFRIRTAVDSSPCVESLLPCCSVGLREITSAVGVSSYFTPWHQDVSTDVRVSGFLAMTWLIYLWDDSSCSTTHHVVFVCRICETKQCVAFACQKSNVRACFRGRMAWRRRQCLCPRLTCGWHGPCQTGRQVALGSRSRMWVFEPCWTNPHAHSNADRAKAIWVTKVIQFGVLHMLQGGNSLFPRGE